MTPEPSLEYAAGKRPRGGGAVVTACAFLSWVMFAAAFVVPVVIELWYELVRPASWSPQLARMTSSIFFGSSPVGLVVAILSLILARRLNLVFARKLAVAGVELNAGMCAVLLLIVWFIYGGRL